ncbi:uncharacterized protein AB9W97_000034 isoform 1-T9 [Spinachia spinachia]
MFKPRPLALIFETRPFRLSYLSQAAFYVHFIIGPNVVVSSQVQHRGHTSTVMSLTIYHTIGSQDGLNLPLRHPPKPPRRKILMLEKLNDFQKQYIFMLCEEKSAWQEERKLLEDICLTLKRETRGVFGKMGGRKFELEKMKKKAKEQQNAETVSSTRFGRIRAADSCCTTSPASPDNLVNLDKMKMAEAQQTIKRQELNISSLHDYLQKMVQDYKADMTEDRQKFERQELTISSLQEDLRKMVQDHKAEMTEAQQTIERQELNISSLYDYLQTMVQDYKADMTEAQQTIERQELNISSLQEDLQKMVQDHKAETTEAQQTIERQELNISSLQEDLQKMAQDHKVEKTNVLKSTNLNIEEEHSAIKSVLTNETIEQIQVETNCMKECHTLKRELQVQREENKFIRIYLAEEQINIRELERDQQILENICLQLKKRLLGSFGRRMEDRATEMEKLRRKSVANETNNRFFRFR